MQLSFALILNILISLQVAVSASHSRVSCRSSSVWVSLVQTHAKVLRNRLVLGLHRDNSTLQDGMSHSDLHLESASNSSARLQHISPTPATSHTNAVGHVTKGSTVANLLLAKQDTHLELASNSSGLSQQNTPAPSEGETHKTVVEHVTVNHTKDGDDSTTTDSETETVTETDNPNGTHSTVVEKTTTNNDSVPVGNVNMTAAQAKLSDDIGKLEVNFEFLMVALIFLAFVMCCFGFELVFVREKVEQGPTIRVQTR